MTHRHIYLATLFVLCATAQSFAQPTFPPVLAASLQAKLDEIRASTNAIGVSVAIESPKYGTWTGTSGMSNPSTGDTVTSDMLFGIGSITKTFTSATILKLIDEERIALDDTIGRWISGYANVSGRITVRQLLNHTSGLYDYTTNPAFWQYSESDFYQTITADDILPFVQAPLFTPGTSWQYCNTGYILLGMIIERETGHAFENEITTRFLKPLALDNVAMGTRDTLPGVLAANWFDTDSDGDLDNLNELPRTWLYSGAWSAGGLISTAANIARWGNRMYTGNVLSPAMLTQMTIFQPVSSLGFNGGYGLGVMRSTIAERVGWGHTGSIPGFGSIMWHVPADSVTIAVLINENRTNAAVFADALLLAYFQSSDAALERSSVATTSAFPNPFVESTRFNVAVSSTQPVIVRVHDVFGRLVRTLVDNSNASVTRSIVWDGNDDSGQRVPAGNYVIRTKDGGAPTTLLVARR